MAEVSLGSFNLHMGRGAGGHDAPFYDVVAAAKEVDTDVLVLQEAFVPDGEPGQPALIADALDYAIASSYAIARAAVSDQVRLCGRSGDAGEGTWEVAVLTRLPVLAADVVTIGPQLPRDPARRAVVRATVDADGVALPIAGTHLPLLKDPVWRLVPELRAALPPTDGPGVFAGDMNMWGWAVERLAPRGWRRAVRGRTFPSHRPHSQTDHVLVTPPVRILEAEVVPQVMSDHRPVRVRLGL
ncbi:MAG TPA: endonuclease/exonuclease/phosphatase family protein [Acidimicrobiales bacterium]|nr:endonuclease/exonuclease/phosphatase family protein [Acidimicrobiales bacterium]